jgi:hypothetical protein
MSAFNLSLLVAAVLATCTLASPGGADVVLATTCAATLSPQIAGNGKILVTPGRYQCLGQSATLSKHTSTHPAPVSIFQQLFRVF